jgi:restriction system protein
MLTTSIPTDWRQLQSEVGRILEECGFTVEVEKTVQTVRGEVELDVYAEEEVRGRRYSIICECKHWKSRVPQNVIHAFRTVVADIGANIGYIVSSSGFQQGAFKASDLTNVSLVTWEEFQNAFERTWLEEYFSPQIAERLDPLLTYAEPFLPLWFPKLSEADKQRYLALKKRYDEFGWLVMSFTPYARLGRDEAVPTLPVVERLPPESDLLKKVPSGILNETGYRQFLEAAIEYGEQAIEQFLALRKTVA